MDERTRTTDPAPPLNRDQMFDDIMEKVAELHRTNREMSKLILALAERNTEFSEAIQDVQASLTALWADGSLTREQIQPLGTSMGELGKRMDRLEKRVRDSQVPEAP